MEKTERFQIRLKASEKRVWNRAAKKEGRPLASWLRRVANEAADEINQRKDTEDAKSHKN